MVAYHVTVRRARSSISYCYLTAFNNELLPVSECERFCAPKYTRRFIPLGHLVQGGISHTTYLQAQGYDTTIYLEPEADYDCIMIASEVVQRIMTYLIIEPSTPELSKHNILLFFRLH